MEMVLLLIGLVMGIAMMVHGAWSLTAIHMGMIAVIVEIPIPSPMKRMTFFALASVCAGATGEADATGAVDPCVVAHAPRANVKTQAASAVLRRNAILNLLTPVWLRPR